MVQNNLAGKVVLITGAGRGLGRALALAFAHQGAVVAANDLNPVGMDETLEQVRAAGGTIRDYIYDTAKRLPVQAMMDEILTDLGRIDIAINNAAVEPAYSILDMDEWDWHRTIDVNLSGPFFVMQHAGRAMRSQGGGVIINVAASEDYLHARPNRAAFAASKAGLVGLTVAAVREFDPLNIRVHAVSPGEAGIQTPDEFVARILFLSAGAGV